MDSDVAQSDTPERPAPRTLADGLARFNNKTPEQAWDLCVKAKWGFHNSDGDSPYEYDQGDTLAVSYDDLYDVADVALTAMKVLRELGAVDEPPKRKIEVHFRGGPWNGQTYEVERVVGPLFAVGHEIGNHYWLDSKSDPPTYFWDER